MLAENNDSYSTDLSYPNNVHSLKGDPRISLQCKYLITKSSEVISETTMIKTLEVTQW